jgi:hypothetical protein
VVLILLASRGAIRVLELAGLKRLTVRIRFNALWGISPRGEEASLSLVRQRVSSIMKWILIIIEQTVTALACRL